MTQKPVVRVTTDGRVRVSDGFVNMAANLGVAGRDKAASSGFVYIPIQHYELINAYRQSWLAQKMIDIVPEDATRNWRQWQADADAVTALEKLEKKHKLKQKYKDALRLSRLTGGAALYYSIRGQLPSEPLDLDRIRPGDLQNVVLFSRYNLQCNRVVLKLDDPRFGEPEMFQLSGIGTAATEIHPSRLAIFNGANVPGTVGTAWNWGDPLLQAVFETVKQTEAFPANVVSLLYEANIDILTIPNLMETMSDPGGPGELPGDIRMATYLKLVAQIKGNNGMLILEGGDQSDGMGGTGKTEFERKAISFAGISDLWDKIMQVATAAADVPMTRLWGRSPGGMNATGESDNINYYQNVNSLQSNEIEECTSNLEEVLIRDAMGGERNPDIHYTWKPLYEESSQSRVDRGTKTVEMIAKLKDTELFPEDTLQSIAKNALVETGALPGIEAAIDEHGLDKTADDEKKLAEALASQALAGKQQQEQQPNGRTAANVVPIRDGKTAPLYVSRSVTNAKAIIRHYTEQGVEGLYDAEELHITVAYSRAALDWMKVSEPWQSTLTLAAGGPRAHEVFGKASVLELKAGELQWRHREIIDAGGSHDFDSYSPHISLGKDLDLEGVTPYQGEVELGPEIWEDIKDDEPPVQPPEVTTS